jgi:hypothetical protein
VPNVSSPAGWWPPFGEFFVAAMLIFYALEDRSPWYILAFAAACGLGSAYGFLQGSWPFGVIGAIWAGIALWRWRTVAGSV